MMLTVVDFSCSSYCSRQSGLMHASCSMVLAYLTTRLHIRPALYVNKLMLRELHVNRSHDVLSWLRQHKSYFYTTCTANFKHSRHVQEEWRSPTTIPCDLSKVVNDKGMVHVIKKRIQQLKSAGGKRFTVVKSWPCKRSLAAIRKTPFWTTLSQTRMIGNNNSPRRDRCSDVVSWVN